MPSGISSLCNFPIKRKIIAPIITVPPANLLFATNFNGVNLDSPSHWQGNFACRRGLSGTDIDTNYAPPIGSPLRAVSSAWGYGISYTTENLAGQLFTAQTLGAVEAMFPTEILTETVYGVSRKVLRLRKLAGGNDYKRQVWYLIQRNLSVAADLPELTIRYTINVGNLTNKLPASNRRHVLFDAKTGHPTLGGDFRVSLQMIRANAADVTNNGATLNAVGWQLQGDNNANGYHPDGTPIVRNPDRPIVTYWCVRNFSTVVPESQYFDLEIYRKKAATYSDLTDGQFRLRIKRFGDPDFITLLDVTAATLPAMYDNDGALGVNRHLGQYDRAIERIFMAGLYGGYNLNVEQEIKVTNVELWDGDMAA